MSIVTRTTKGSMLSHAELDANFVQLQDAINGDVVNNKGNISGAVALNMADGNYVAATVVGATTFSISGVPSANRACGLTLELTNGGTNVTWPGSISWVGGTAPTLKASGINLITLITRNGGTSWLGTSS